MTWLLEAACRGEDPHLFFGRHDPGPALNICRGCDHRVDCLDAECAAVDRGASGTHYGVVGGTLPAERYDRPRARVLAMVGRQEMPPPGHRVRTGRPAMTVQRLAELREQRAADLRRRINRGGAT